MSDNQTAPTAEDMQKMQAVSEAGASAAQEGKDPAEAMKGERDRQGIDIPDEVIDKIATAVSAKNIAELENRGAFDPVEPVQPPQQPAAPPPPGEQQQQGQPPAAGEQPPQQPKKVTFADRFMGRG